MGGEDEVDVCVPGEFLCVCFTSFKKKNEVKKENKNANEWSAHITAVFYFCHQCQGCKNLEARLKIDASCQLVS